jgi:hypothetical protein
MEIGRGGVEIIEAVEKVERERGTEVEKGREVELEGERLRRKR